MQKSRKRIVSAIVSASLVLGLWTGYAIPARAEENGSGQTPPTEIGEPTPTPTVTPSASPSVEPSTEPSAEPTVTPGAGRCDQNCDKQKISGFDGRKNIKACDNGNDFNSYLDKCQ